LFPLYLDSREFPPQGFYPVVIDRVASIEEPVTVNEETETGLNAPEDGSRTEDEDNADGIGADELTETETGSPDSDDPGTVDGEQGITE